MPQAHGPKKITKIVHSMDTDSRIPVLPLLTGFKFDHYNTGWKNNYLMLWVYFGNWDQLKWDEVINNMNKAVTALGVKN